MVFDLDFSELLFKLANPFALLLGCFLELFPLLQYFCGHFVDGIFVNILALLDLSQKFITMSLKAFHLLLFLVGL